MRLSEQKRKKIRVYVLHLQFTSLSVSFFLLSFIPASNYTPEGLRGKMPKKEP